MKIKQLSNHCLSVEESDIIYIQSYNSIIAKYDFHSGQLTLGKNWKYSKTTLSHLIKWMKSVPELSQIDQEIDKFRSRSLGISYLLDKGIIQYDENL